MNRTTAIITGGVSALLILVSICFVRIAPVRGQSSAAPGAVPPPPSLQGGPIDSGGTTERDYIWYLPPDGRIVAGDAAEPFPLDPALGIRSISFYPDGMVAATADGIYFRPDNTYRWEKISDVVANFISYAFGFIFITPQDAPGEVWQSTDGGLSWTPITANLNGTVVSSVRVYTPAFYYNVMTVDEGRYVIWQQSLAQQDGFDEWQRVATVPGNVVEYQPGGIGGGYSLDNPYAISPIIYAGSTDGNLYRFDLSDPTNPDGSEKWEVVQSFGSAKFPLVFPSYAPRISVIDLNTGDIELYQRQEDEFPFETWEPVPFAASNQPWGAAISPTGDVIQRSYGNFYLFASLFLTQEGALVSYESTATGTYTTTVVTETPQFTDFLFSSDPNGVDFVGPLYHGASLTWDGANCTGDTSDFYRSSDKGASWILVASGAARTPIAALPLNQDQVLATSCTGPTITVDGGQTWQTPADLGWPLPTGPQLLRAYARYLPDLGGNIWSALYAAGVTADGQPYLYVSNYDENTGTQDPWLDITPEGMAAPTALFVNELFGASEGLVYMADANTVWLTEDNGNSWQSRSAGLNGVHIRDISLYSHRHDTGLLAATDQGLYFTTLNQDDAQWIAAEQSYTTDLIGFQAVLNLNGPNNMFRLLDEFFIYQEPTVEPTPTATITTTPEITATPTITVTATPSTTATPEPTATPSPTPTTEPGLICEQLELNGDFETDGEWTLPVTACPADYSDGFAISGSRSLRIGVPFDSPDIYSYSTAYQWIDLPADAERITLSAQLWRGSEAPAWDSDLQYAQVMYQKGWRYTTETLFEEQLDTRTWEPLTYDLTAAAGGKARLLFGVYNTGANGRTVMYVDNVQVEVCRAAD